jgi:hypothetical protein
MAGLGLENLQMQVTDSGTANVLPWSDGTGQVFVALDA